MKPVPMIPALLLPLMLGACVSVASDKLRFEAETDLAELGERWDAMPKHHSFVSTRRAGEPEVDVALWEVGDTTSERLFVLIHGVNSNHETWRFVVAALGTEHDVLLVDLPGCGDSGCPDPRTLGRNGYSPNALAERVLQALDAQLADRGPSQQITLVGHSLGGTIAIRMMDSLELRVRYDRVLRHVDRMVLFAPADVELVNPSPELLALAEVSGIEVGLADILGILRARVDEATFSGVVNPDRALHETADKTRSILRNSDTRLALQAMLLQAVPRVPDGGLDWPIVELLVADYANVDVPCVIVWGRRDETLPAAMGYKLAAQIPTAELRILENCKHSIQLECPEVCADIIRGSAVVVPTVAAGFEPNGVHPSRTSQ